MNSNQPDEDKRLDKVLAQYKKSLTNWVSRADNNLPPNNQKGRIVQEIDAEAKAALRTLLIEAKQKAIQDLVIAQGTYPEDRQYGHGAFYHVPKSDVDEWLQAPKDKAGDAA